MDTRDAQNSGRLDSGDIVWAARHSTATIYISMALFYILVASGLVKFLNVCMHEDRHSPPDLVEL